MTHDRAVLAPGRSVGEELVYWDVDAVGGEVEDLLCRIRSDTLERGHG